MTIDREKLDTLLKAVGDSDRVRLTTLYNAMVSTLKAYNQDSTAARLKDWQAAEKALAEAVVEIEGKSNTVRHDPNPVIGTIADVIRWLQSEGYCAPGRDEPVRSSKVYQDRRAGLLTFEDKKAITVKDVMAYVANAQLMQSGVDRASEVEDLKVQKLRHETRKAKADADSKEFANAVEQGLYLKKEDVELQDAMKISLFESLLKHTVRTTVSDLIRYVEGNLKKTQGFCDKFNEIIDDALDQAARMDEINVIVKRSD